MQRAFLDMLGKTAEKEGVFAVVTVIAVRGSSSAKPGSKAIIGPDGRNLWGWVGGGCAESFIIEQALETLAAASPRVITVDLDDELLGVGMPCGGYMDVYIEPFLAARPMLLLGEGPVVRSLSLLASLAGFAVTVQSPNLDKQEHPLAAGVRAAPLGDARVQPGALVALTQRLPERDALIGKLLADGARYLGLTYASAEETDALEKRFGVARVVFPLKIPSDVPPAVAAIDVIVQILGQDRNTSGKPLSLNATKPLVFADRSDPELAIIGRGRIAEELARLGVLLGWPVTVNDTGLSADDYPRGARLIVDDLGMALDHLNERSMVVIASQHKGDHRAALTAIRKKAAYIALIASRKRAGLVLDYLREKGCRANELAVVHAPAGVDIVSRNPFEIGLRIFGEMLGLLRENGGRDGA